MPTYQRWYRTGTVALTNGSTAVTGTLTGWLADVRPGDAISADGTRWAEIASIETNTGLTLAAPWNGATYSGPYVIDRRSLIRQMASDVGARINAYLDQAKLLPAPVALDAAKIPQVNAGGTAFDLVALTKALVGLGSVDNTPDSGKPVSTAQAAALALKADAAKNRERLTAALTVYARADGNDANDGLSNTAGGAKRQLQSAIDLVASLDLNGQIVKIKAGTGTYNGFTLKRLTGGVCTIEGDTATPTNCVLSGASGALCYADGVSGWTVTGFNSTGNAHHFQLDNSAAVDVGVWNYGATTNSHNLVHGNSQLRHVAAYTISGGCYAHHWADDGGRIKAYGFASTVSGSPAWAYRFAYANNTGSINYGGMTYTGAATGTKHLAQNNGVIQTFGVTLPGSAAGSTATGGQFS